jgi:hypothetical protein
VLKRSFVVSILGVLTKRGGDDEKTADVSATRLSSPKSEIRRGCFKRLQRSCLVPQKPCRSGKSNYRNAQQEISLTTLLGTTSPAQSPVSLPYAVFTTIERRTSPLCVRLIAGMRGEYQIVAKRRVYSLRASRLPNLTN